MSEALNMVEIFTACSHANNWNDSVRNADFEIAKE
jgi:hypothetical protein